MMASMGEGRGLVVSFRSPIMWFEGDLRIWNIRDGAV